MLKKFLLVFALVCAALGLLVSQRPAAYAVLRSAEVHAPVEFVFEQVADLRAWQRWSPWEDLDPALVRHYQGAPRGVGARYDWAGNGQVGVGHMIITELDEDRRVGLDVHIEKPMPSQSRSELTFAATPAGTRITWEVRGEHDFLGKAFAFAMDMDALVGSDLEKGLAQLATVAESAARSAAQEAAEDAARRALEAAAQAEHDAGANDAEDAGSDAD